MVQSGNIYINLYNLCPNVYYFKQCHTRWSAFLHYECVKLLMQQSTATCFLPKISQVFLGSRYFVKGSQGIHLSQNLKLGKVLLKNQKFNNYNLVWIEEHSSTWCLSNGLGLQLPYILANVSTPKNQLRSLKANA